MTVQYSLQRRDVWNAYWYTWRTTHKLKLAQAVIAGAVFFVALAWLSGNGQPATVQWLEALGFAVLGVLWLPLYPLIRFKPQMRTLNIGPTGLSTTIGQLSGEVPWSKLERVEVFANRLYVIGRTGNSFTIPNQAFTSPEEKERFLHEIRSHLS